MKELKANGSQLSAYRTLQMNITKFFEQSAAYLVKKLPLTNVLLKNLGCLSPLFRCKLYTIHMVVAVVEHLPHYRDAKMKDDILREWQLYQEDGEIVEDFYIFQRGRNDDGTAYIKYCRLDEYWHKVMQLTGVC